MRRVRHPARNATASARRAVLALPLKIPDAAAIVRATGVAHMRANIADAAAFHPSPPPVCAADGVVVVQPGTPEEDRQCAQNSNYRELIYVKSDDIAQRAVKNKNIIPTGPMAYAACAGNNAIIILMNTETEKQTAKPHNAENPIGKRSETYSVMRFATGLSL